MRFISLRSFLQRYRWKQKQQVFDQVQFPMSCVNKANVRSVLSGKRETLLLLLYAKSNQYEHTHTEDKTLGFYCRLPLQGPGQIRDVYLESASRKKYRVTSSANHGPSSSSRVTYVAFPCTHFHLQPHYEPV